MAKIQISLDEQGWPIPGRIPFWGKKKYIAALYEILEEKREAVEAGQRGLEKALESEQCKLEHLSKQVIYLNDTLRSFDVDFRLVEKYSARLLDTSKEFDDENKSTYPERRESLSEVWVSFVGIDALNKVRVVEWAFNLAETCRVLVDSKRPDLKRLMETRVLYEIAKELTEDHDAVNLAAEARLLELKYVTLKDPTIDASFARLAHEDPALMVGRYGPLESLSMMTRAALSLSPKDDQRPSAQFLRAMYEIRRNNAITDEHRFKFDSAVGRDPTLIEPLMNVACASQPLTNGSVDREVKLALAKTGLLAAVKTYDEPTRVELYARVNSSLPPEDVRQIFAEYIPLRNDLFETRFQLGFKAGFERNIGNEATAQAYEARLAGLPSYE